VVGSVKREMTTTISPLEIYKGSDGEATKALYARLSERGPLGLIAVNLFRAQKCSERAKVYRGGIRGKGRYKDMAYERKQWSMDNLCAVLVEHGGALKIVWGWKPDPGTLFGERESYVLYVETPNGQCSFHSPTRGKGPDYPNEWDGQRGETVQRVIDFTEAVLAGCNL